jgi:hypothetical protein
VTVAGGDSDVTRLRVRRPESSSCSDTVTQARSAAVAQARHGHGRRTVPGPGPLASRQLWARPGVGPACHLKLQLEVHGSARDGRRPRAVSPADH